MTPIKAAIAAIFISTAANAEPIKVMQFNQNVRIVLTTRVCPMDKSKLLAVAQRLDSQYKRGCYSYEPSKKLVRIQWSEKEDDFSILDADRFYNDNLPEPEVKGEF